MHDPHAVPDPVAITAADQPPVPGPGRRPDPASDPATDRPDPAPDRLQAAPGAAVWR